MLIGIFYRICEPLVTSSLSGAMIYTLAQSNFTGVGRILAFFISFFMGIVGADVTTDLMREIIPYSISHNRNVGAFICSALVVTLSVNLVSFTERNWMKANECNRKDF